MKNIVKTLVITSALLLSALNGYSQQKESFYSNNEFSIGLGTAYSTQGGFKSENYNFNLLAEASYFPVYWAGISTELPFYTSDGVSLREVGLSLVGRVPLYRGLAFQTSFGSYYNWKNKDFDYTVEPMILYRFNPKWQIGVGGQYRIDDFKDFKYSNGQWQLRGVVSLIF